MTTDDKLSSSRIGAGLSEPDEELLLTESPILVLLVGVVQAVSSKNAKQSWCRNSVSKRLLVCNGKFPRLSSRSGGSGESQDP